MGGMLGMKKITMGSRCDSVRRPPTLPRRRSDWGCSGFVFPLPCRTARRPTCIRSALGHFQYVCACCSQKLRSAPAKLNPPRATLTFLFPVT